MFTIIYKDENRQPQCQVRLKFYVQCTDYGYLLWLVSYNTRHMPGHTSSHWDQWTTRRSSLIYHCANCKLLGHG